MKARLQQPDPRDPIPETLAAASRSILLVAALALVAQLAACAAIRDRLGIEPPGSLVPLPRPEPGEIRGRLVRLEGAPGAGEARPVVVYLEPVAGGQPPEPGGRTSTIRQRDGRLSPSFLAIAAGDTVRFSNQDEIYHSVFSSSDPNEFDLGVLRRGDSKAVTLRHPGVVRLYSALHETVSGVIFVTPSPHFAVVRGPGAFEIRGVPAGSYRIRTWGEEIPSVSREVRVQAGDRVSVEIPIEESGAHP